MGLLEPDPEITNNEGRSIGRLQTPSSFTALVGPKPLNRPVEAHRSFSEMKVSDSDKLNPPGNQEHNGDGTPQRPSSSGDIGGNSTLTTPTEETAHAPLTHEWSSAVGHAGTGKSGRVIHNLQEDIARLNRECTLQQLRADETRQANETLKLQLKSLQEARDHAQQLHETDLHSISLRDRKIAALQTELARERERRGKSEEDARRTNQIAAGERDTHHREVAEAQELAAHLQVQYETLAKAQSRDRGETQARINRFKGEIAEIVARETERQRQIVRLDVIMEQKNREQDLQGERMHNFIRLFDEYRERNDELVSGMLGQAGLNDKKIDALAEQATDAIQKFKWATTLQSAKEQEQEKSENGQQ